MTSPRSNRFSQVFSGVAIAAAFTLSGAALAEDKDAGQAQEHSQHAAPTDATSGAAKAELSESSKAFEAAMEKMHKQMTIPYTNDVDEDFVRGMIPHHQGAIDQAEVLLKYSKNLRLRRLAGGIIAAQRREIRFMQNWLKEHASGTETADMPEWLKNNPASVEDAAKAGAKD